MNRLRKTKSKIKSINYYILLSVLIHLCMFLFTSLKKDIALGDKIIPIEIIDIPSEPSQGEYFRRQKKKAVKKTEKNLLKEKVIKKKIKEELVKEDKTTNIKEASKVIKNNNYIAPSENSTINKDIGSEGNLNSNEVEKGSLKGKGEEKITCLSCLKPKYPKIALKRGYEGIVKLKIFISKNGEVSDIEVIKTSGYKILDNSGIDAAKKSRFYPLKKERTLNIEYDLKLNR